MNCAILFGDSVPAIETLISDSNMLLSEIITNIRNNNRLLIRGDSNNVFCDVPIRVLFLKTSSFCTSAIVFFPGRSRSV